MNVVLFDDEKVWQDLAPLTFTRPISEIRIGILTIKEKWDTSLETKCSYLTQNYLQKKFPLLNKQDTIFINATLCPTKELIVGIKELKAQEALLKNNKLLAFRGDISDLNNSAVWHKKEFQAFILEINRVWDIFQKNDVALKLDFENITQNRVSQNLSKTVTVIGDKNLIFLEEGAKAEACIFNTTSGPIYLGADSEVMEGSAIRGPFSLGEHSALKLNTKIYGATSIGPHCKIGGEVNNTVVFAYSNKAHDGFLGNSVIGEWCNLGADTNNSNLKNNYGAVKLYNYFQKKSIDTGLQFCGLIMGDYSKSGINTMFNTGTVVGVGSNIYGGGFPSTNIPNFSWGGSEGFESYRLDKLYETAEIVFERRGLTFGETEKQILAAIASQFN
jgi:UDP-N-acetylglucosamine diphosphorylase/glucosamine-1-phosphate N-acetyltransferase